MTETKKCNVCGEMMPLELFAHNGKDATGNIQRKPHCRKCASLKARQLYTSREAAGLCVGCGGERKDPNIKHCQECLDKIRKHGKSMCEKRRHLNLCIRCGEPARDGKKECQKCADNYSQRAKAQYQQRKQMGRCVTCGQISIDGINLCKECNEKQSVTNKKYYSKMRKAGLCVYCGRPSGLNATCVDCRNKESRKREAVIRKVVDYLGGSCQICGLKTNEIEIYDCHHVDPKEKEKGIGELRHKDWAIIIAELEKCILLCANCHRRLHKGRFSANILDSLVKGQREHNLIRLDNSPRLKIAS